jgi:two-component system response regulator YesN
MGKASRDDAKRIICLADKFLNDSFSDPDLTLEKASRVLHLSSSYLSRLYKRETGHNYIEALTAIRLSHAKMLLKSTSLRVSAVAASSGYRDVKYFCTIFKRDTGFTPGEFRES